MRETSETIERRRAMLEAQKGEPYLTPQEAAEEGAVSLSLIYHEKERYRVEKIGGTLFVPRSAVVAEPEPLVIQGVELKEHVGRVTATRYLCPPCRYYFRTREAYNRHECPHRGGTR